MTFTKKDAFQRLFLWPLYFLVLSYAAPAISAADCASKQFDETSTIKYVHDGDTLHLQDGRKVRLIGINTPELARDNKPAEAYAEEAKYALKSLFERDKSVALVYGKDQKDRYGRLLAHAFLADGQNVQALLLARGLASAIIIPPNSQFASCYLQQENRARCSQTGLWQNKNILNASELKAEHLGFHLIQGEVVSIDNNSRGTWLNLDNKLTVGIRPENQGAFDLKSVNNMLNQSVIVRGWLNRNKQGTPFYLRVHHPLSLQPASALSCR